MKKLLPKTKYNQGGFTLVELLVVIVILAVLAVIAYASFGGLTNRGNDSRRLADIKAIADVYEVRRTATMPDYGTAAVTGVEFSGGAIPADPTAGRAYCVRTGTAPIGNAVVADMPAGVCAGGAGNGSAGWNTYSGTAFAAGQTYYKICVLTQGPPAEIKCVGSKQ